MTMTNLLTLRGFILKPPVVAPKAKRLVYSLSFILLTLLTTLVIARNGADCLINTNNPGSSDGSQNERVYIVKSAATNQTSYKKVKESFKEVFDKLTIQVKENTPIGSKLADIQADDQDSHSAKIIYAIVGGSDQSAFTLEVDRNINKVELVNEVNFDYESTKKSYHVIIRATSLFLRYEVDVDILVTDENDNKPQLDDFAIIFNNHKSYFPTAPIGKVPATDADVNDQLRFKVLSGNNAQLVVVNETSGEIQLSPWLKSNVPMKAVITIAVSDGLNEAVAQLVLSVNLITDTMLQNSVMLRLEGISREEFLSKKYDVFVHDMARILGPNNLYATKNIVLFDVEEYLQELPQNEALTYHPYNGSTIINSTVSVNISFSARSDNNDIEAYLSNQYIEERININRAHLMQSLELSLAQFPDNLCANEPCQSDQECRPIYKFEKASKTFIATKNMIFRPIKAIQGFTCKCLTTNSSFSLDRTLSNGSQNSSSVCSLCNCDESKGYDPECDKSTGQCFCKPNHYQPPNSEYCLPCDCYNVGSLVTSCNQTTGQCLCRQGVVGRRCDTCTGSYAEVTLRGCEVIYDTCPKTFSDGIWWEKTQLDKLATQQCPPLTSTGTATRSCHKTEGWQKANMFDCLSNSFKDLYDQYQILEDNKILLTTDSAMKTASNLRNSLNETISNPLTQLFGTDMYISFRLLHHLIQYEIRQSGLNLTHTQDRSYIRNIVESINYILDPEYADNWPEMAKRSPNGGAEYLLKLIDAYGKVLIESQSDTSSQPFEISTKYLTLGMDKISTDQLWDFNKFSTSFNNQPASASMPPYATDPFGPPLIDQSVSISSPGSNGGPYYNPDGSSVYLDFSNPINRDSSPSVIIPKYDNFASNSLNQHQDATTKVLVPLKTILVKTIHDLIPTSTSTSTPYQAAAKSRAKRDNELIIHDSKFNKQQPALVVYSIYRSLGPLLLDTMDNTVQHGSGLKPAPNSPVVWLTLRATNGSEFLNKNIHPKINYMLKINDSTGKTRPQCATWDFINQPSSLAKNQSNSYGIKQTGKFTTKGCEIKGIFPIQRMRFKYEYVNCSCDHLGAVTVLMDSANYDYLVNEETNNKDMILVISLLISLFILSSASFILTCIRGHSIKSNSNTINKNLIFILIIFELLILYNVASRSTLNQREYQCKLIAIFLHYFSISLFFWLLVNAIHFYRMLTELRDINHGAMKFYHVIGYVMPAFLVSLAVGLRMEQFGGNPFCWLSIQDPIIWSMFAPISIASIAIVILFMLAFCKSLPIKEEQTINNGIYMNNNGSTDLLKNHMFINVIKTPLIGFHWLITIYVVNEALLDYNYLLPTFTVLKSVILFVLLCIIDKYIRYNLYVSWLRFRGKKIPFVEDSINYSSNQWIQPSAMLGADSLDGHNNKLYNPYAGYNNNGLHPTSPGYQGSCTDIFRPDVLAFSVVSTTSRSSDTESSSPSVDYQQYKHHRAKESRAELGGRSGGRSKHSRRRHKKSHHKHHHHHHHHRHHHHRSHRHQHEDEGQHYESNNHKTRIYTENNVNEVLPPQRNEMIPGDSTNHLASSHSSDGEENSTIVKKSLLYSAGKTNLGAETNDSQTNLAKRDPLEEKSALPTTEVPSTSGQQETNQQNNATEETSEKPNEPQA